jgi:hypothetical protein
MFRRNLYGPRLVSWEALFQLLANDHLTDGKYEFHWNLLENGKFSVASLYNALTLSDLPVLDNKKIWKMKIPLKTKVFAWYLCRGVILTKDNLFIKRNWHESKTCVFCTHDETIKHLFFQCNFVRSIWSVIQAASALYPPTSIANVFGNWIHGIDNKFKILLRVGAIALIRSLWLCRNDKVFDNKNSSLLQEVIYRCTGTLRLLSQLYRMEDHDLFSEVCTRLEDTARHLFSHHG